MSVIAAKMQTSQEVTARNRHCVAWWPLSVDFLQQLGSVAQASKERSLSEKTAEPLQTSMNA
jgi:hypothetical protein